MDISMAGCDGCSMCCKLLAIVEPTLKKPLNQWCQHCTKPGCGIYEERPAACKEYACVYLQSQSDPNPLPLKIRPDKCKVVIDITPDGTFAICRVDPNYPRALESLEMKIVLTALSRDHTVIASYGLRKQIMYINETGRKKLKEFGLANNATSWTDQY